MSVGCIDDEKVAVNLSDPKFEASTVLSQMAEVATPREPLLLTSGAKLEHAVLAYETYGTLSPQRDNAILIFHALSGSQHAAGINTSVPQAGSLWTDECHEGWWNDYVGPGKGFDTNKYFVVCANYLGGCYGSTGPRSRNPKNGAIYGGSFPKISTADIVRSQARLLNHLGIKKLHAVAGGSLGGVLALNFATLFPERVTNVIPICSGQEVTMLQRLHNLEQIVAIETDLNFCGGNYDPARQPESGLALARMISHKTFLSLDTMTRRARNTISERADVLSSYQLTNSVESYILHQGRKFVSRFDANSYLRIMEVWQTIDLLRDAGVRSFAELYARCKHQNFLIFSVDSDVCFYPEEQVAIARSLQDANVRCRHITVHSEKGHDAFLLEPDLFNPYLSHFMGGYAG